MSFFELTLFCRDLNIVPKLVTKDELILLWKIGNMEKVTEEQPDTTCLKFEEFCPFLARLALVAYNKPGLKKIIVNINGSMLSPLEQINSLAYYLHLDDINRIKIHIDTVGRETANQLNNRSVGDKNTQLANNLRRDIRGNRLAKLLSTEKKLQESILTSHSDPSKGSESPGRAKINDAIDELYAEDSTHREAVREAEHIAAVLERKRRLEVVLRASTMPSHTKLLPEVTQQIQEDVHHRIVEMINQVGFQFGQSFDDAALDGSAGGATLGRGAAKSLGEIKISAVTKSAKVDSLPGRPQSRGGLAATTRGAVSTIDAGNQPRQESNTIGALASSTGVEIATSQETALVEYTPALSEALRRFCVVDLMKTKADNKIALFDEFGGGFADIGPVPLGSQVTIKVKIVNRGVHEMNIQVSTRNFIASSLSVIKMPRAIAPGMNQVALIKFTAPDDYIGPCLAFISVNSVSNPNNLLCREEYVVDCPVFYNISHFRGTSAEHPIPDTTSRCTLRSLQALIAKDRSEARRAAAAASLHVTKL
jgi:hypothetical protein